MRKKLLVILLLLVVLIVLVVTQGGAARGAEARRGDGDGERRYAARGRAER